MRLNREIMRPLHNATTNTADETKLRLGQLSQTSSQLTKQNYSISCNLQSCNFVWKYMEKNPLATKPKESIANWPLKKKLTGRVAVPYGNLMYCMVKNITRAIRHSTCHLCGKRT